MVIHERRSKNRYLTLIQRVTHSTLCEDYNQCNQEDRYSDSIMSRRLNKIKKTKTGTVIQSLDKRIFEIRIAREGSKNILGNVSTGPICSRY